MEVYEDSHFNVDMRRSPITSEYTSSTAMKELTNTGAPMPSKRPPASVASLSATAMSKGTVSPMFPSYDSVAMSSPGFTSYDNSSQNYFQSTSSPVSQSMNVVPTMRPVATQPTSSFTSAPAPQQYQQVSVAQQQLDVLTGRLVNTLGDLDGIMKKIQLLQAQSGTPLTIHPAVSEDITRVTNEVMSKLSLMATRRPTETAPMSHLNPQAANFSVQQPAPMAFVKPASPPAVEVGTIISLVEFKRQRIKKYESVEFITPGNYVIVEGDRGTDCGLVIHSSIRRPDGSLGKCEVLDNLDIDTTKVKPETGRVLRIASRNEVTTLHGEIAAMERHALKTCRERVQSMNLDMTIVDCEFQWDRKKVTFFFESQESIDFRELTRDLYRSFGARIWLENINTKVKNTVPEGAMSHAEKMMLAERGIPPSAARAVANKLKKEYGN